jgi:hypothetical protein
MVLSPQQSGAHLEVEAAIADPRMTQADIPVMGCYLTQKGGYCD